MKEEMYQIECLYIPFVFIVVWIIWFMLTTAILAKYKDCNTKTETEREKDSICILLKNY